MQTLVEGARALESMLQCVFVPLQDIYTQIFFIGWPPSAVGAAAAVIEEA